MNKSRLTRPHVAALLDIGSHKCVCMMVQIGKTLQETQILGIGHVLSKGIRHGLITDAGEAETSILTAVNTAEKMAGESIDKLWVSLSMLDLTSRHLNVDLSLNNHPVSDRELMDVLAEAASPLPQEEMLLHSIPMHYTLDNHPGIRDPRGMIGGMLQARMLVTSTPANHIRNLTHCLHRYQLEIAGIIAAPYASALACLEEDEKELGTILIDIGGSASSYALFSGGRMVDAGSIGVGGNHITQDVAHGLNTSLQHAERLKNVHGGVLISPADDTVMIEVPHLGQSNESDSHSLEKRSYLNHIIRPRAEEILELARHAIENNQMPPLPSTARVVLTGGGSQLLGMADLAQHVFGRRVRVAGPRYQEMLPDSISGPAFSTLCGMIDYVRLCQSETGWLHRPVTRQRGFGGVKRWLKWFRESV